MNKIYFALALGAALAACTTAEDNPASSGNGGNSGEQTTSFAKIDVVVGTLEDARDGKTYKTVKINDQNWMAENLNYAIDSSFCPMGIPENCDKFGRLYTWAVAMDSSETVPCGNKTLCDLADSLTQPIVRGICPEGWHLPTDNDWDTLIEATGDVAHAAKALKSKEVWTVDAGVDQYQFNVIPTGNRSADGNFYEFDAHFWSSTESTKTSACGRFIDRDYAVKHRSGDKKQARSVRCIQD